MTLATKVTASEAEVIRVYTVALPDAEARKLTADDVATALGVTDLDPEYVDIFPVEALDEFGLKGYMTEGLGISAPSLENYAEAIKAAKGTIVVVLSKAFKSRSATLKNGHPLRLIGAFTERKAESIDVDLTSQSAAKQPPKTQKSQAAQSGMVATAVLLFMFAFVALIVWIS
jgi:hypothetical protein